MSTTLTTTIHPATPGGFSDTSALAQLTSAERAVAGAVATGAPNKAIGHVLLMSSRTVEAHLTRVYRKLGVANRTELAMFVSRHTPVRTT
jgi:DNA-binding NarL/FixJ family response regulator